MTYHPYSPEAKKYLEELGHSFENAPGVSLNTPLWFCGTCGKEFVILGAGSVFYRDRTHRGFTLPFEPNDGLKCKDIIIKDVIGHSND